MPTSSWRGEAGPSDVQEKHQVLFLESFNNYQWHYFDRNFGQVQVSRGDGAHVAGMEVVEEEAEQGELDDHEDLEQDPEAYEAYAAMAEREEAEEDEEDGDTGEDEGISPEELREAWAAGWRAKDRVAEKRKGRNFRQDPRSNNKKDDPRKKSTTCSSCGNLGHWKGDPECPKVKSGEDKLFQPKPKKHGVHLVSHGGEEQVKPTHIDKNVKVHEINFSFVMSGQGEGQVWAESTMWTVWTCGEVRGSVLCWMWRFPCSDEDDRSG